MSKFFTILTKVGEAKLANATALGQTVQFQKLAVGDGNGVLPTPNQNQTALVNEVRREMLNAVEIDSDNPNWIICEQVIPENVGGWTIREVGIYDIDGDLIAVGNFPETYKPILEEGSGRTQTVRIVLQISSSSSVELKIDPSIVLATRKYVDDKDAAHVAISQFLPYSTTRVYTVGEVCYTKDANGKVSYWEWYSNVESLAGKDPLNTANRRIGWTDETKPYYWKPRSSKMPGETMAWDADTIPENMVVGMGQQLPVAVYHSLANARPDWIDAIDNTLINIPDRQGRFVRAANGSDWLAGETHEDAIRNIQGSLDGLFNFSVTGGALSNGNYASTTHATTTGNGYHGLSFDASRVVPTAAENQPKAYIEWVGYAL